MKKKAGKPKKKHKIDVCPWGARVSGGISGGPRNATMLYRITWDDGTVTYERGQAIFDRPGFIDLNGTKEEKAASKNTVRTDLHDAMKIIQILMESIEAACWNLDHEEFKEDR